MAEVDVSSSSDDNWFEPEDITISTVNLLQQQQQQANLSQQTKQSQQAQQPPSFSTIQPIKEQIETITNGPTDDSQVNDI